MYQVARNSCVDCNFILEPLIIIILNPLQIPLYSMFVMGDIRPTLQPNIERLEEGFELLP